MADTHIDLYSASCNPPRRAKRPHADSTASHQPADAPQPGNQGAQTRPILPRRSANAAKVVTIVEQPHDEGFNSIPKPTPNKRGRKPGPLSRTAREAQRRLNHSIIEKARRTKINEALATLRDLVPADYGSKAPSSPASDDEESQDESSEQKDKTKDKKTKGTGKKEEKEKEFKLEILIRTVSFLQDLLARVAVLEANGSPCSTCPTVGTKKRKRSTQDDDDDDESRSHPSPASDDPAKFLSKRPNVVGRVSHSPSSPKISSESRLPSISSWLPNSGMNPVLLTSKQVQPNPITVSHLPSPPASTHFEPLPSARVPPTLNLGPVATAALLSPKRTPEDESAATLLLQISTSSPTYHPLSPTLLEPPRLTLSNKPRTSSYSRVETPSSLLGMSRQKNT